MAGIAFLSAMIGVSSCILGGLDRERARFEQSEPKSEGNQKAYHYSSAV